jgi:hypothetical protein
VPGGGSRVRQRLALRPAEAASSLGVQSGFFDQNIPSELRWGRRGLLKLVAVAENRRAGSSEAGTLRLRIETGPTRGGPNGSASET